MWRFAVFIFQANAIWCSVVALVHDFSGDCWREVSRNGQLLHDDASANVRTEVPRTYDRHLLFLPVIFFTSGPSKFFDTFGLEPFDIAFTFRRAPQT